MEPRIQYTKTSDGVSIAYASVGEGPQLIFLPSAWTQFSLNWSYPAWSEALERLGGRRQRIEYDRRGFGLSQRDVVELTLETGIADLEAVFAALGLQTAALFADTLAGPTAIAYAANQPNRVSHLILYGTFASRGDVMQGDQLNALVNLCRTDWHSAAQLFADQSVRELLPEDGVKFAEIFRQSASGENVARLLSVRSDLTELLPLVKCPTLVIHRRSDPVIPFSAGQKLAAAIPNSEFLPLEGSVHAFFLGDHEPR